MRQIRPRTVMTFVLLCLLALPLGGAGATETPKRGGILTFVVAAEPPSFDGHREPIFALIHPIGPFYSMRIRVNPENSPSPTDFVGDLALDVPAPTDDGTTYTFTLRQNATLWWYRIVPHRASVRGWKISPSHFLNQDLANVWLAQ